MAEQHHPSAPPPAGLLPLLLLLIPLACSCVGGGMLLRDAWRSSQWEAVEATVLETSIERVEDADGVVLYPVVSYSYAVDGRSYGGEHRGVGSSQMDEVLAQLQGYPDGTKLDLRVHPGDPAQSALPGRKKSFYRLFLICGQLGALLLFAVQLGLILHNRLARRESKHRG